MAPQARRGASAQDSVGSNWGCFLRDSLQCAALMGCVVLQRRVPDHLGKPHLGRSPLCTLPAAVCNAICGARH
eukprot:2934158-Rhodomonas_salina.4